MAQIFIKDGILVLAWDGPGLPSDTSLPRVSNVEARDDGARNWVLVEEMLCKNKM